MHTALLITGFIPMFGTPFRDILGTRFTRRHNEEEREGRGM